MNKINPKKLLNSKWTAINPKNKEMHFIITEVEYDEDIVVLCELQAIMTKRSCAIDWNDLKDKNKWIQGWK